MHPALNKSLHFGPLVILIVAACSLANVVTEWSLEEKVEKSSLVVLGQVLSTETDARGIEYAEVRVETLLKGRATESNPKVIFRSAISEFDPDCCEVTRRYLMFLEAVPGGAYRSVNGPFGIYRISNDGRSPGAD